MTQDWVNSPEDSLPNLSIDQNEMSEDVVFLISNGTGDYWANPSNAVKFLRLYMMIWAPSGAGIKPCLAACK